MTLQEFKAWFDGFTEAMEGPPSVKQWGLIKTRVKEIDGTAINERIFIDRYWPVYLHPYTYPAPPLNPHPWPWYATNLNQNIKDDGHMIFNSTTAMQALGQAEQLSLS